jgi:KaiC/GvpD/RAD55 family RecA-like ATPase
MDILEEHLPEGTSMLIVGPPGSGKTILSQYLMHHVLKRDKSAICIAPTSQVELIASQKKLFNWDISPYIEGGQFGVIELGDVTDPTELNITLTKVIKKAKKPFSMVVLDSLTMFMMGMEQKKILKFAEALSRKLQSQKVSLLLLIAPAKGTEGFLTKMKSLVSSVIEIKLEEKGTIRRYMRIFKFLHKSHSTQWYLFEITDDGIQFIPVLSVCPYCGYDENPEPAKFCMNCGTQLPEELVPASPLTALEAGKVVLPSTKEIVFSQPETIIGRRDFMQDLSPQKAKYISREHLIITFKDGKYYVLDENSKNGTTLNGMDITGRGKKELNNNDEITLGDTITITFYR